MLKGKQRDSCNGVMQVFGKRGKIVTRALVGVAVAGLSATVVNAFSTGFDSQPVSLAARGGLGSFTPASIDPRLASDLKFRALNDRKLFRFTPAGSEEGKSRAITVAVRVNPESAKAINIRPRTTASVGRSIAPTISVVASGFSLGTSRGYQRFALPSEVTAIKAPDLANMGKGVETKDERASKSRFSPKIELETLDTPGKTLRSVENESSYSLDFGGSYSVTKNLDVTAGVQYRSERDRLAPITNDQQDSQAVYVGTQFRF